MYVLCLALQQYANDVRRVAKYDFGTVCIFTFNIRVYSYKSAFILLNFTVSLIPIRMYNATSVVQFSFTETTWLVICYADSISSPTF